MHILVDLDGVLADFCSAALRVHGRENEREQIKHWNFFEDWGLGADQFWECIHNIGESFWTRLEPYPWMQELLGLCGDDFTVATSPSLSPECVSGKVRWLREHINPRFSRYMLGYQKWLMAKPGVVLIDDSDKNVEEFRKHGGEAILMPQPWNSNRDLCDTRMRFVRTALQTMKNGQPASGIHGSNPSVDPQKPIQPATVSLPSETPLSGENPKDGIGSKKPPLHLIPSGAEVPESKVLALGAAKYGAFNWRTARVRASVYLAAARRHMLAWYDGEHNDPESGLSHLAHARASIGILMDAMACGTWEDDRPTAGAAAWLIKEHTAKDGGQ